MLFGSILVSARNQSYRVERLGMRCDGQEIPYPLDDAEKLVGTWAGVARVTGKRFDVEGSDARQERSFTGGCAITITDDRVLGIIIPMSRRETAVWFTLPLNGINALAHGHQRKRGEHRPATITVGTGEWMVALSHVARLRTATDQGAKGQERALLDALLRTVPATGQSVPGRSESRELKEAAGLLREATRLRRNARELPGTEQAEAIRQWSLSHGAPSGAHRGT